MKKETVNVLHVLISDGDRDGDGGHLMTSADKFLQLRIYGETLS